jgi:dienelactone hydrolase
MRCVPDHSKFHSVCASLIVLLLASCAANNPSDNFNFDYTSAKISDFNGFWEGPVDCRHQDGWKPHTVVEIKNGVGKLSNFGNWGVSVTADLDIASGKIKWVGTYDNHEGNSHRPFSLKGQWMKGKFALNGSRGNSWNCSAVLSNDPQKIIGVKRKTLRFAAYDPGDYAPVFHGDWRINKHQLRGIVYHGDKNGKQPLVVLMHGFMGVGGAADAYQDITKMLAEKRASVLMVKYKLSIDVPGRVVATFEGIKEAAKLPWIDSNKIFLVGLSTGGMQAIHSIVRTVHDKLNDGSFKIAGILGVYPSCRVKFEESETINTKVVLMTGELDNETPGQQCVDFIRESGLENSATHISLEDVGHSWLFSKKKNTTTKKSWAGCGRLGVTREGYFTSMNGQLSSKGIGMYEWLDQSHNTCRKSIKYVSGRTEVAYDRTVEEIKKLVFE